jgi:hypothetical protein
MSISPFLLHLGVVVSLVLLTGACATAPKQPPGRAQTSLSAGSAHIPGRARAAAPLQPPRDNPAAVHARGAPAPLPLGIRELGDGSIKLFFPPRPMPPALDSLSVAEVRSLREALEGVRLFPEPRLRLLEVPGPRLPPRSATQQLQFRVREEFLAAFGPGMLPLLDSAEGSPLWVALKMSPRFMDEGVRQAAEELFNSPLFIHGVYLSVMLYFSAWLMPEPVFSKAVAATLTVRLAMLVGLVELTRVAQACLRLYQEAQAARTPEQLEAASARFGMTLGGVGFRVVVLVATMGWDGCCRMSPRGTLPERFGPGAWSWQEALRREQSPRRRWWRMERLLSPESRWVSPSRPPVSTWACAPPWRAVTVARFSQLAMVHRTLGAIGPTMRPSRMSSLPGRAPGTPDSTRTRPRGMPQAIASLIPSQ